MLNIYNRHLGPLWGNTDIKEYLSAVIADGSLSHSYIIEGPSGSGRHTLAICIACALAPLAARKIADGNCPDVSLVSRGENRKTIGVDTIRALKEAASLTANELDVKIFIIEYADSMTLQAQNAFLKLLEEPPRDVYMFLLCENSAALLPTVRSRAPFLRMQIFNDDELDRYLIENEKKAAELRKSDPEAYNRVILSASGRIGIAMQKLSRRSLSGDIKLYNKTRQYLKLLTSQDKAEYYLFSAALAEKREELADFFTMLENALRDLVYCKSLTTNGNRFLFYPDYEEAAETASRLTSAELMYMINTTTQTHESLDMNVNLKSAMLVFAGEMWDNRHKQ
ncbi:MAG: hypothetical protein PHZ09_02920 [Eubacteriales bacterium]|nr:hypothetical protein [Eubacteriales bacterium]